MYYAVGERIFAPKATQDQIRGCAIQWAAKPLQSMIKARGKFAGSAKERLTKVVGVNDLECSINLMPPESQLSNWDRGKAERYADILKPWLNDQKAQGVFLLGTKVMQAVTRDRTFRFFDVYWVDDVPCLCLPHPSGRGRWLSDPDRARQCREEVSRFYAATVDLAPSV